MIDRLRGKSRKRKTGVLSKELGFCGVAPSGVEGGHRVEGGGGVIWEPLAGAAG